MSERIEPLAAQLAGNSPAQVARRYWLATRPAFFTASVLPVVVGTAWGHGVSGNLDLLAAVLALVATVFIHAGANVINDVADEMTGTDRVNVERIFPYTGGSRFIQNDILTLQQMRNWGIALLVAGSLFGAILTLLKGPMVLAFGLAGFALAVLYSVPPVQLVARGVGELAIAAAFGVIPVTGAAWLQSGDLDTWSLLVSIPVGMYIASILLINEVPDIAADAQAGKRTLPVRFGAPATRVLYVLMHLVATAAFVMAVARGQLRMLSLVLPLILLVMAVMNARGITDARTPEARKALTTSIERTLAIQTLGCLWLAVWAWFAV